MINSKNNFIKSDCGVIAVVGASNLIIIKNGNNILVAEKGSSNLISKLPDYIFEN